MGWSAFLFYSDLQWIWWGSTRLGRAIGFVVIIVLLNCVRIFASPWNFSVPGYPALHSLPQFAQTHVDWVGDAIQPFETHGLCSPSGSSIHGILQARTLERVAIPSPGDLSDPGIKPRSPTQQVDSSLSGPPGSPNLPYSIRDTLTDTSRFSVWPNIWASCGPIKLTQKTNPLNYEQNWL